MNFWDKINVFAKTTEQDVMVFMGRVWAEEKILASEIAAAAKWIVEVGLPGLEKNLDAALPFITAVSAATGHAELGTSLTALDAAVHGVNSAISSAQAGTLTADQVAAAYGSLKGAEAIFNKAVGTAATITATTQPSTLPKV